MFKRMYVLRRYFAGIDQFFYWFCYQCKLLPMYALATRICPPGVEATMIAVVMSLNDAGYSIASYYGAGLSAWAGIEENECGVTVFDALYLLYAWRIFCRLLPAIAVLLIPTEEQISKAMEALAKEDERAMQAKLEQDEGRNSSVLGQSCRVDNTDNPIAIPTRTASNN